MKPNILINPRLMWACAAGEQTRLKLIEGTGIHPKLPKVNDIVTLPFIVDPETNEPTAVRVLDIQERMDSAGHLLVAVVTRADQPQ